MYKSIENLVWFSDYSIKIKTIKGPVGTLCASENKGVMGRQIKDLMPIIITYRIIQKKNCFYLGKQPSKSHFHLTNEIMTIKYNLM